MNENITLPPQLRDDIQSLTRDLGLVSSDATVQYLLQKAVEREKKLLVANLYQKGQKTMRQCAALLNVDLEEMMDILRDFEIPFHDDITQQIETAKKLVREMQAAQP